MRMLGEGRPFILEVHNARRRVPPAEQLQQLEARVAEVSGWVAARAGGLYWMPGELHQGGAAEDLDLRGMLRMAGPGDARAACNHTFILCKFALPPCCRQATSAWRCVACLPPAPASWRC